eukprot:TRINITY_DN72362_c0_g1_i1.p1 TRINITY_DN72362_c0_g1~~TRINITY_DN72362_c0_g1_i1.p1  ORF type:complete len:105 (-),score=6.97 TRINITY_DN72362_c0_g1_i1:23-337(-)
MFHATSLVHRSPPTPCWVCIGWLNGAFEKSEHDSNNISHARERRFSDGAGNYDAELQGDIDFRILQTSAKVRLYQLWKREVVEAGSFNDSCPRSCKMQHQSRLW